MTTRYINQITTACPVSMLDIGNHMAACLGESIHDLNTYGRVLRQDANGVQYAVCSTVATNVILLKSAVAAVRPAFDTDNQIDLDKANAGLSNLVIYPQGELTGPAEPDKIVAYLNVEPHEALALMGLVEIENDVTP
jgi:hypothetical protein